jgi:hypothetical protein
MVRKDGSYNVLYTDGDTEGRVERAMVRVPSTLEAIYDMDEATLERRQRGDETAGMSASTIAKAAPAKVEDVKEKGDKCKEKSVEGEAEGLLEEGTALDARFDGGEYWYPGWVSKAYDDNTYDVLFADGDKEERVPRLFIRVPPQLRGAKRDSEDASEEEEEGLYEVEAIFKRRKTKAKRKRGGSSSSEEHDLEYYVKWVGYDDTENTWEPRLNLMQGRETAKMVLRIDSKENAFRSALVANTAAAAAAAAAIKAQAAKSEATGRPMLSRVAGSASANAGKGPIKEGTTVSARWGGQSKWYPGKVEKANDDGTYSIRYDDGDGEERIKPNNVKVVVKKKASGSISGGSVGNPADGMVDTGAAATADAPPSGVRSGDRGRGRGRGTLRGSSGVSKDRKGPLKRSSRGKALLGDGSSSGNSSANKELVQSGWACVTCTYVNKLETSKCQMCRQQRPAQR